MLPNHDSTALKVYSRRRRQDLRCQDEAPGDEPPSKQQLFFRLVSRTIGSLLPPPKIMKKKKLPAPPPQELHRSRRVAKLGAEHIQQIPKTKKMVMRVLQFDLDRDHINQQELEDYAKLFSRPLSCPQVQALASLFRWSVPDNVGVVATLVY
jgi:hypothetical protein